LPVVRSRGFPWMVVLTHSISGADHLNSGTRRAVNPLLNRPARIKAAEWKRTRIAAVLAVLLRWHSGCLA